MWNKIASILEEVYSDKAIYACFANEIYKNINFIEEIEQQCEKYIDRLVGQKKM